MSTQEETGTTAVLVSVSEAFSDRFHSESKRHVGGLLYI